MTQLSQISIFIIPIITIIIHVIMLVVLFFIPVLHMSDLAVSILAFYYTCATAYLS